MAARYPARSREPPLRYGFDVDLDNSDDDSSDNADEEDDVEESENSGISSDGSSVPDPYEIPNDAETPDPWHL